MTEPTNPLPLAHRLRALAEHLDRAATHHEALADLTSYNLNAAIRTLQRIADSLTAQKSPDEDVQ